MPARKAPPPWGGCEYTIADVSALKACMAGEASPEQAQRAVTFIVNNVADTYGMGWHPDGDHASSFAAGKRHVGREIVKFVNTPIKAFEQALKPQRTKSNG